VILGRVVRRHTRLLAADAEGIETAAAILRARGLVAFPTETVYGLGAYALDAEAVRGIFEAKSRPADDPVIVHLADAALLGTVARLLPEAWHLARCFWPGPLTLVLPRQPGVPDEVTAGLDTVGVRVPSHPVAVELLKAADLPVAAPSANLFGRPSPTRAEHVLDDLDGRIDAILDAGPTRIGVESTIVDLTVQPPRLLRPGGLPVEEIESTLGVSLQRVAPRSGPQLSPGLLPVHYSPRTPLTLIIGPRQRLIDEIAAALNSGQRVGVVTLTEDAPYLPSGVVQEIVGTWSDPTGSATRLFDALRRLDQYGLDMLFARQLADPASGLGRALADRLRRASERVIDAHE
jgi:L-threonylcarbamoyladenylate synthase